MTRIGTQFKIKKEIVTYFNLGRIFQEVCRSCKDIGISRFESAISRRIQDSFFPVVNILEKRLTINMRLESWIELREYKK